MIDRERQISPSAVLTAVTVAAQHVFPRKDDLLVGDTDIEAKAHNAWKRDGHGDRVEQFSLLRFDQLRLSEKEQHNRFSDIAHTHRFIVLVQDQHFAIESTEHFS